MSDGGKGSNARPYAIPKEEFNKQFDKIFGEKERTYCDVCNKKFSWCSCVAAPKEVCDAIDKALGIKRKKKKVNND
jgi:hypothetical protein